MIDISKLTEADKGREVFYRHHGFIDCGRITSWNSHYIFVAYHTKIWRDGLEPLVCDLTKDQGHLAAKPTGMATRPEDLEWA